jgi:hypothetical protein
MTQLRARAGEISLDFFSYNFPFVRPIASVIFSFDPGRILRYISRIEPIDR